MKLFPYSPLAATLCLSGMSILLAGCGGGGGAAPTPATAPSIAAPSLTLITADNFTAVGANALAASEAMLKSPDPASALATGLSYAVLDLITRGLIKGVTLSGSDICDDGKGSASLSGSLRDRSLFSGGDRLTFAVSNCAVGGVSLNGAISVNLNGVAGDVKNGLSWSAGLGIQFTGLTLNAGADQTVASGDLAIGVEQTGASNRSLTVSGNALRFTTYRGGVQVAERSLGTFNGGATQNGTARTSRLDYGVSGTAGALGAYRVNVATSAPLAVADGANPTTGSLVVTGANGSAVTLTALDGNNVRLDYDDNGDGKVTQSLTTSWAGLRSGS